MKIAQHHQIRPWARTDDYNLRNNLENTQAYNLKVTSPASTVFMGDSCNIQCAATTIPK